MAAQIDRMVKKNVRIFAFIGQDIEYKSQDDLILVWPHLAYFVQFRLPH